MAQNTPKVFYKKRLVTEHEGLVVWTDKWVSVRETDCLHFCVMEFAYNAFAKTYEQAKERNCKMKRVLKSGSRFAFPTEAEALEHLKFLKRRQLSHMRREIKFIEAAVTFFESGAPLEKSRGVEVLPGTQELVHEFVRFD